VDFELPEHEQKTNMSSLEKITKYSTYFFVAFGLVVSGIVIKTQIYDSVYAGSDKWKTVA